MLTRSRLLQLAAGLVAAAALVPGVTGTASASTKQISIIQDGYALFANPSATLSEFRDLGATTTRVLVQWKDFAPHPNARNQPRHFNPSRSRTYPQKEFAALDSIITTAKADGITVDLDPTGPPPRWAQGTGVPRHVLENRFGWKVKAGAYGRFVTALARRYDGSFKPTDASRKLPKVRFWSLWNEPNFGQDLGPQAVGATRHFDGYDVAAGYYRNLVRNGWRALKRDHRLRGSTILVGEYAGQGRMGVKNHKHPQGLPGNYAITPPIPFIQTLYCVDARYQRLTGKAARLAGCPTSAKAARSFRKDNPGLFDATGISSHPYASKFAPNKTKGIGKRAIILPVINRLEREMRAVAGHYGRHRSFPIYSTEYGFVTSPPQRHGHHYPSPSRAATYLNEAEYLSWRNSKVASFAQYLLRDPPTLKGVGLFASGLFTSDGKPKPARDAYRLPLWMPHQTVKRNRRTEVWGGARPAIFGHRATRKRQRVSIQLQRGGHGDYTTIATVTASARNGYFNAHIKIPAGGRLRLRYTYPQNEPLLPAGVAGSSIVSRTVKVRVH